MKTQKQAPSLGANNRAAMYCRVSTREQEETGYSLPAQSKLLKERSDQKGFNLIKEFCIAESASGSKQRKVFGEMMEFLVKNNISHLLCEKVDRLTRNLKEAVVINDWLEQDENRYIHFVKQNLVIHKNAKSDEKFRWDIEIVLAKKYIANLSEEVKKGQVEKIAEGWLPTKPPLGYMTIGDKGKKIHVIDKGVAPLMRDMFDLYATGNYSLTKLEEELYSRGLRARSGKRVLHKRLHVLIQDPFYYGSFLWKSQKYSGKHEPIIGRDLFDKVQKILKRKINQPRFNIHNPLFKTMIVCEGCGKSLTWEKQKSHWYGHCNNHLTSRKCPKKTYIREEKVEEQLRPIFKKIAPKNKDLLKWIEDVICCEFKEKIGERENEIHRLNTHLGMIRTKKDKIYMAKLEGTVPLEFCERQIAHISAEEENFQSALVRINNQSDEYQNLALIVHELAFNADAIYEMAENDDKRVLFNQLFTNFWQNSLEIKSDLTLLAKYFVEWMPRLSECYEPDNTLMPQRQKGTFVPSHPSMLPR